MKSDKKELNQNELVVEINVGHKNALFLCLVLITLGLLGYLSWGHGKASASVPQSSIVGITGLRQYYLTNSVFTGNQALNACVAGFHMASLWEILDPSHLEYNSMLGRMQNDSGGGPPTYYGLGWVRTGYLPTYSSTAGEANCSNWTETTGYYGTTARLPLNWEDGADMDVGVWDVEAYACDLTYIAVWCVED